jgi:hypothetical protein
MIGRGLGMVCEIASKRAWAAQTLERRAAVSSIAVLMIASRVSASRRYFGCGTIRKYGFGAFQPFG